MTASLVSLVAYQGLRIPEEVLALEARHVGRNTLLVEQRLIKGELVGGQKVRGFRPRPVPLEDPVRRDVAEYLVATGLRRGLRGRALIAAGLGAVLERDVVELVGDALAAVAGRVGVAQSARRTRPPGP